MYATARIAIWQIIMTVMQPESNGDKSAIHTLTEKIEKLERSLSPWENALIIFIAITAVAALAIFLSEYGSRKIGKQLKDANSALNAAKDAELAHTLAEDNARIEENKGETAKANERAQKLEHANLTLRGELNRQTGEIAVLQKAAADAKTAQAKAEKDLLELQERVKLRHLSAEQRKKLIDFLRAAAVAGAPKGPIQVSRQLLDETAQPFAEEIKEAFGSAGWTSNEVGRQFGGGGPTPVGLIIMIHSDTAIPAHAGVIQRALITAGLEPTLGQNPNVPEGMVEILIGVKP
jgi:hypothetical protein